MFRVVLLVRNDLFKEIDDVSTSSSSRIFRHNISTATPVDVTLIPNPGITQFKVITKNGNIKSVLIRDITGSNVKYIENKTIIDINDLSAGVYFVTVYLENEENKTIKYIKVN